MKTTSQPKLFYKVYKALKKLPYYLQRQCLLCRCDIDKSSTVFGLCSHCINAFPEFSPSCQQCGDPTAKPLSACGECLRMPPHYDQTVCFTRFNRDIQYLIHQLKQQHDLAIRRCLADSLVQAIRQADLSLDAIIAVPMHWRRAFLRGNNHSALLASHIAKKLAIVYFPKAVKKVRHTQTQRGLAAKQRNRNLRHAFYCQENMQGLHIGIIDDVMTTGSTMNEIAKVLKQAGAIKVSAITVAKT